MAHRSGSRKWKFNSEQYNGRRPRGVLVRAFDLEPEERLSDGSAERIEFPTRTTGGPVRFPGRSDRTAKCEKRRTKNVPFPLAFGARRC